jgi:alpha 1,3-glucosidase
MDVVFPGSQHFYGIPEHATNLHLKPTLGENDEPYRLYNLDVFEYELDNPMALYGSIPFLISHSTKRTAGVFFHNSAEMWIDINYSTAQDGGGIFRSLLGLFGYQENEKEGGDAIPQAESHWIAESGVLDMFIVLGPKPADVFQQYSALTGKTYLPPLFSLAYHQSRWNYNDQADVSTVNAKFDEFDIPLDVIWLDIEHTDGKRYFTWDTAKFPDPKAMLQEVGEKGRLMVTIVDPHIKRASGYRIHEDAQRLGYYVKNKERNDYDGWCWPGSSSWLDFMDPVIRSWWSDQFSFDKYEGSAINLYTWNDMNEPSVFNGPEVTMHKDNKHYGGWEHRDVHNIYGMWQQAATADGIVRRSGGAERPFVLSRAFFAGSQKYGAIWTGDNTADWNHLRLSVPMILSINVAGLPFAGADMGGFFGNPDRELLIRWYQAGAFQPFMRAHAHLDTKRREPYLYDKADMLIMREAVRTRYTFLPYWYTLFHNAHVTGMPVVRPLWVEYPGEEEHFSEQETYLVGSDLLVAPVLRPNTNYVTVKFPGSQPWYDINTFAFYAAPSSNSIYAPLEKIPVFQRGGSIIPRKMRVRRSSSLGASDPFTLYAALDSNGNAQGELYVDDYHTHLYSGGQFILRKFSIKKNGNEFSFRASGAPNGHYQTAEWIERIVVVGLTNQVSSVSVSTNGSASKQLTFEYDNKSKVLVIKKPSDNIALDFVLTITTA